MSTVGTAHEGGLVNDSGPPGDQDWADYQRGRTEGTVWAREYATRDELRDLVDGFEPGRSAPFATDHSLYGFMNVKKSSSATYLPHDDTPFWQGFADGAREVLDELSPLG